MQTATGRRFWPLDPRPEDICIEDVAAALSRICRFGGHCSRFYSVAQHSVLVSHACAPVDALWGLLHDATEAYVGDIVRPLKRQPEMSGYRHAEERLMRAVCRRFELDPARPESVVQADEALLSTEARDLMGGACLETWTLRHNPLPEIIRPWGPRQAEQMFLMRFGDLTR